MSRLRKAHAGGDDQGLALVSVLGIGMVLTLLVSAAVVYSVGTQRGARASQDWNGALAAAYAGVEEYQSRMAADTAYYQYGNPAARFSTASGSSVRMPPAAAANAAFSLTDWATIPGSEDSARFRYEVDNSRYFSEGILRLRSTGLAGGETRSIVAELRQKGFIEFLYFTDYEIMDPEVSGSSLAACSVYRYAGRSTANAPAGCGTINFVSADTINGPLHSNDGIQVCGTPKFLGHTTSSFPQSATKRYYVGSGCTDSPQFSGNPGNKIGYQGVLGMPETNTEMKKETRPGIPDEVPSPGCLYTGPTSIVLTADGKMRVKSPWTKFTSPVAGVNNSNCGTPGTGGLGAPNGQVIDVKNNNLVYVQNVPELAGEANYWAPGASGTPTCLLEDRTSSSGRNADGNPVGYPIAGEYVSDPGTYGCKNGDVFIEGTLDGRMTVAAENYVYVTNDIKYESSEDTADGDMLGLVGQNAVIVHNPRGQSATSKNERKLLETRTNLTSQLSGWDCRWTGGLFPPRYTCDRYENVSTWSFSGNSTALKSAKHRRIDAAILSVAHTFIVQNYDTISGDRGTLTVNGAISQKFRGPVGTGSGGTVSTGYSKNYQYDQRFRTGGPPKFLSPVTTTYGINVWIEVSPAFGADGTYR